MTGRRRALVAVTLVCCGGRSPAAPANVDTPARALLHRVLAGPSVAFNGLQCASVYSAGGNAIAMVQVYGNGRGSTRRVYQAGAAAGVVLLQVGRAAWRRVGRAGWLPVPGSAGTLSAGQAAEAILRNYDVRRGANATMLGMRVVRLDIVHRAEFNPSKTLWVEPHTGLVLREVLMAPDGRIRSSSVYVRLAVRPQPAGLFIPPSHDKVSDAYGPGSLSARESVEQVERDTGRRVPLPGYVPTGFRATVYGVITAASGRLMPAVRYSDGVAAFTVVQRGWRTRRGGRKGLRWQGDTPSPGPGPGACVSQSDLQVSTVTVHGPRANYVLAGDIAADELARIGKSLL